MEDNINNMDGACVTQPDISNAKSWFWECFLSWFRKKNTVSVLRLSGVVGKGRSSINFEALEPLIEKAFNVSGCKAVILLVNSPGGAPAQCEMISASIMRLAADKQMPVYSFIEDVAASAGYWIAASADAIYANRTSIVGSIGVLYSSFGFVDIMKKLGVERRAYCAGERKLMLDPFLPEKEEDIVALKRVQQDMYNTFKDHVISRRKGKIDHEAQDIFSGMFWTGPMAMNLGLIDGIKNYKEFIVDKFGKNTRIVTIKRPQSWWTRGISLKLNINPGELLGKIKNHINFYT